MLWKVDKINYGTEWAKTAWTNVLVATLARPDVQAAVTNAIHSVVDPKMEIYPVMAAGASDGSFFRAQGIPVYDVDGSWGITPIDDRAHGLDERIPVRAMYDDVVYWEKLIRSLAG